MHMKRTSLLANLSEIRLNSSQGPDEGLSARLCMYMCSLRVDGDVEGADGVCQRGRRLTGTCPVSRGSSLSLRQEFLELPVSSSSYQMVALDQMIVFLMATKSTAMCQEK